MNFHDIVDLFNAQSKDKSAKLLISEANRPLVHRPRLEVYSAPAPFRSVGPQRVRNAPASQGVTETT
eukprot:8122738-Pyramimonas_sp.AAC.1